MREKIQVLVIEGGMTFNNEKDYQKYLKERTIYLSEFNFWSRDYIKNSLKEDFEIIAPKMPLKENARYLDWKTHFERYLEKINENIILIGWSLGGIFLSKYLSENKINKNVLSTYLVAAPFDDTLVGEDLAGGFELQDDLSLIQETSGKVNLMFSEDDPVIPISHADKYKQKLPDAKLTIFEKKGGHFIIEEFPEIIESIKEDVKKL